MEVPRHWRLKNQRYRLEGSICPNCGEPVFPRRPVCLQCAVEARSSGLTSPVLLASLDTSDIEPQMRYEFTERMIR